MSNRVCKYRMGMCCSDIVFAVGGDISKSGCPTRKACVLERSRLGLHSTKTRLDLRSSSDNCLTSTVPDTYMSSCLCFFEGVAIDVILNGDVSLCRGGKKCKI